MNCAMPCAPFLLTSSTRSRLSCQSRLAKNGTGRSLSWAEVKRVLHKLSSEVGCGGAVGVSLFAPPTSEFSEARRSGASRNSGLSTSTCSRRGPSAAKFRRSLLWAEDSISTSPSIGSRLERRSSPRSEYFGSSAAPLKPSSRIVKTIIARISPFPHTRLGSGAVLTSHKAVMRDFPSTRAFDPRFPTAGGSPDWEVQIKRSHPTLNVVCRGFRLRFTPTKCRR